MDAGEITSDIKKRCEKQEKSNQPDNRGESVYNTSERFVWPYAAFAPTAILVRVYQSVQCSQYGNLTLKRQTKHPAKTYSAG